MNKLNELTIEIVQQCPNHCLHCSSLSGPNVRNYLPAESVLHVAAQASELVLRTMSLSGGEPLLHPHLGSIVAGMLKVGLDVAFYTTGIRLNEDLSAYAQTDWSLFPHERAKLIFSLQSAAPDTHDRISGRRGAFELTRRALLSARAQGHLVELHIVPNKQNLFDLEETVRVALGWGVHRVSFLRLVPQGYACDNIEMLAFSEDEEQVFCETATRLAAAPDTKDRVRFGIPFSAELKMAKKCTAADGKLIIRHDGKILPCEAFKDERFTDLVLGDIRDTRLEDAMKVGTCVPLLQTTKASMAGCESCPAQQLYRLKKFRLCAA